MAQADSIMAASASLRRSSGSRPQSNPSSQQGAHHCTATYGSSGGAYGAGMGSGGGAGGFGVGPEGGSAAQTYRQAQQHQQAMGPGGASGGGNMSIVNRMGSYTGGGMQVASAYGTYGKSGPGTRWGPSGPDLARGGVFVDLLEATRKSFSAGLGDWDLQAVEWGHGDFKHRLLQVRGRWHTPLAR